MLRRFLTLVDRGISCITYWIVTMNIHDVYRFFSTQPNTQKAKMNQYTVLESQNCLSTTPNPRKKIRVGTEQFAFPSTSSLPTYPPTADDDLKSDWAVNSVWIALSASVCSVRHHFSFEVFVILSSSVALLGTWPNLNSRCRCTNIYVLIYFCRAPGYFTT